MKKKAKAMPPRPAPKAAKAKSAGKPRAGKTSAAPRAVRRPSRVPAPGGANSALAGAVADLGAIALELRELLEALRELIVAGRAQIEEAQQAGEGEVAAVVISDEEA